MTIFYLFVILKLYTFILSKKNGIENLRNISGNKKIGMKSKNSKYLCII